MIENDAFGSRFRLNKVYIVEARNKVVHSFGIVASKGEQKNRAVSHVSRRAFVELRYLCCIASLARKTVSIRSNKYFYTN